MPLPNLLHVIKGYQVRTDLENQVFTECIDVDKFNSSYLFQRNFTSRLSNAVLETQEQSVLNVLNSNSNVSSMSIQFTDAAGFPLKTAFTPSLFQHTAPDPNWGAFNCNPQIYSWILGMKGKGMK